MDIVLSFSSFPHVPPPIADCQVDMSCYGPGGRGAASDVFLLEAVRLMESKGYRMGNIDVTIIAERPKISPHKQKIMDNLYTPPEEPCRNHQCQGTTFSILELPPLPFIWLASLRNHCLTSGTAQVCRLKVWAVFRKAAIQSIW